MRMTTSIEVHNQIIFRRFYGKVCIDDMVQSWKEIFNNYEDLEAYKGVVTSFLEADIQHEDSNMNVIMEYLSGYLERIRGWGYEVVRARQLLHNRREICVAAMQRAVRRSHPYPRKKTTR